MLADATLPSAYQAEIDSFLIPDDRDAWSLAASVANDGLWYFDIDQDVVCLSARSIELLGYGRDERPPEPTDINRHVHASDIRPLQRAVKQIIRGEHTRAELDLRLLRVDGALRWALVRMRGRYNADGTLVLLAGSLTDIDQRKRTELQLREDARRDALTGLLNRAALSERLTARMLRAARRPLPRFALLYIDLDRFKLVNDSLGHATGDVLLRSAADRIAEVIGPNDLLARVGGDEFVVLLDAIADEQEAIRLADAMHDVMRALIPLNGRDLFTSLSVGIRLSGVHSSTPSDLLRDADVAMYQAKRQGGGRSVIFDHRMNRAMVDRLRVQTELAFALRRSELRVAYQPIFDTDEGRLSGFEALVRWQHPTRGPLTAGDFVEDANESGLIVLIGRWMLNVVCAQLAAWRRDYPHALPLTVALNLFDREIVDPEFTCSVEEALRKYDLPASALVIEMSEEAMTANAEHAIPALRRLRELGVQIQMDGFGRGYSSLSVLRRMPLTAIKIDRSYIAGVAVDAESRAMVGTINAFARALGLEVVAEGVETLEQATALAAMGHFRYVQGNHFGRPAGEAVAKELLDES